MARKVLFLNNHIWLEAGFICRSSLGRDAINYININRARLVDLKMKHIDKPITEGKKLIN
jgi:hypothetical protein